MAAVKINSQHHYVTLRVDFADKRRFSLTISVNGTKGTSSAPQSLPPLDKSIFNRVFKAWDAATYTDKTPITGNVGERVAKLAKVAEACATPADLADAFEAAISGSKVTAAAIAAVAVPNLPKAVTRPIAVIPPKDHPKATPADVALAPLPKEGSGKFIQRLWMSGVNAPDALVELVLKHYPGRTTKVSDVAYNVSQLRKLHGAANVPAWPKAK